MTYGSSMNEEYSNLIGSWCPCYMLTLMCLLWFFTRVFWGIIPSTNLVDPEGNSYTALSFFFLAFFYSFSFWNLEISSYMFLLFCVLFCSLFCSFFFTLLSDPCFFLSLSVYSLYFLISLIFFSNLLSFLFSFAITLFCVLLPYVPFLFNLFSFCYYSSF